MYFPQKNFIIPDEGAFTGDFYYKKSTGIVAYEYSAIPSCSTGDITQFVYKGSIIGY